MLHSGFERGTDLIDGERYDPILVVAPDRRVYKGATRSLHLHTLTGSGGKGGDDLTVFRLGQPQYGWPFTGSGGRLNHQPVTVAFYEQGRYTHERGQPDPTLICESVAQVANRAVWKVTNHRWRLAFASDGHAGVGDD